jgi:hypothetical protein
MVEGARRGWKSALRGTRGWGYMWQPVDKGFRTTDKFVGVQ